MKVRKGVRCSVCPYYWRRLKDGTVATHYVYTGLLQYKKRCLGSREQPYKIEVKKDDNDG